MGTKNSMHRFSISDGDEESTDLAVHFQKKVRPLLDAAFKLHKLEVFTDVIPLPTIVLIGDESNGTTAVLEALTGITFSRPEGIEAPLVVRLQKCSPGEVSMRESATTSINGGSQHEIISLEIRKPDAPDLTCINLHEAVQIDGLLLVPENTGYPRHGDEYALIQYSLRAPATVILNVLSALTVDFSACKSTLISQEVDKLGERTIAVITNVNQAPVGIHDKVTAMEKNFGINLDMKYIFVESYGGGELSPEHARSLPPLDFCLSVGISALAERVTELLAKMIRSGFAVMEKEIEKSLIEKNKEIDDVVKIISRDEHSKECYPHEVLAEMATTQDRMRRGDYFIQMGNIFHEFTANLFENLDLFLTAAKTEEILRRMTELGGFSKPDLLSQILVSEEVDKVSDLCTGVVKDTHNYAMLFALDMFGKSTALFPHLRDTYKQISKEIIAASRGDCTDFVHRTLAKERSAVFTVNKSYMANVNFIQNHMASIRSQPGGYGFGGSLTISGIPTPFPISEVQGKPVDYQLAYGLKMNLIAYLSVVFARIADGIVLEVRYTLERAFQIGLTEGALDALMGGELTVGATEDHKERRSSLLKEVIALQEARGIVKKVLNLDQ